MAEHRHITEPNKYEYQVRIVRNKSEFSRTFAHKQWGNKIKSLVAAKHWRDQMLISLGATEMKSVRVYRSIEHDKRRDTRSVVYQAPWVDDGKKRSRKFWVGKIDKITPDMELHAFRSAMHFRAAFKLSCESSINFNPADYKNWRKERVYE